MISYMGGPLDGKTDSAPIDKEALWDDNEAQYYFEDAPQRAHKFLAVRSTFMILTMLMESYPEPPEDPQEREHLALWLRRAIALAEDDLGDILPAAMYPIAESVIVCSQDLLEMLED